MTRHLVFVLLSVTLLWGVNDAATPVRLSGDTGLQFSPCEYCYSLFEPIQNRHAGSLRLLFDQLNTEAGAQGDCEPYKGDAATQCNAFVAAYRKIWIFKKKASEQDGKTFCSKLSVCRATRYHQPFYSSAAFCDKCKEVAEVAMNVEDVSEKDRRIAFSVFLCHAMKTDRYNEATCIAEMIAKLEKSKANFLGPTNICKGFGACHEKGSGKDMKAKGYGSPSESPEERKVEEEACKETVGEGREPGSQYRFVKSPYKAKETSYSVPRYHREEGRSWYEPKKYTRSWATPTPTPRSRKRVTKRKRAAKSKHSHQRGQATHHVVAIPEEPVQPVSPEEVPKLCPEPVHEVIERPVESIQPSPSIEIKPEETPSATPEVKESATPPSSPPEPSTPPHRPPTPPPPPSEIPISEPPAAAPLEIPVSPPMESTPAPSPLSQPSTPPDAEPLPSPPTELPDISSSVLPSAAEDIAEIPASSADSVEDLEEEPMSFPEPPVGHPLSDFPTPPPTEEAPDVPEQLPSVSEPSTFTPVPEPTPPPLSQIETTEGTSSEMEQAQPPTEMTPASLLALEPSTTPEMEMEPLTELPPSPALEKEAHAPVTSAAALPEEEYEAESPDIPLVPTPETTEELAVQPVSSSPDEQVTAEKSFMAPSDAPEAAPILSPGVLEKFNPPQPPVHAPEPAVDEEPIPPPEKGSTLPPVAPGAKKLSLPTPSPQASQEPLKKVEGTGERDQKTSESKDKATSAMKTSTESSSGSSAASETQIGSDTLSPSPAEPPLPIGPFKIPTRPIMETIVPRQSPT